MALNLRRNRFPNLNNPPVQGLNMDEEYKKHAREEYEELMQNFELRCHNAALMNYITSSSYDWWVIGLELVSAILFICFVVLSGLNAWSGDIVKDILSNVIGLLGIGGSSVFTQLLARGNFAFLPSFSERAKSHTSAAAGWQMLAYKTRHRRIQLDNPAFGPELYAQWFNELNDKREAVCKEAVIYSKTHAKYEDPRIAYNDIAKRKHYLTEFLRLEAENTPAGDDHTERDNSQPFYTIFSSHWRGMLLGLASALALWLLGSYL